MSFYHSPRIATDGLVFYYDALNYKSYPGAGTNCTDLSRTGNNGILSAAAIGTTTLGNFDFNGTSHNISGSIAGGLNAPFTIETFVKFDNATRAAAFEYVVKMGTANGANTIVSISKCRAEGFSPPALYGGQMYMYNGSAVLPVSASLADTNYHHIVILADTSAPYVSVCHNGVAVSTTDSSGAINTNGQIHIGNWETTWWTDGKIPITRIYNRKLTTDEVYNNFLATKKRYGL